MKKERGRKAVRSRSEGSEIRQAGSMWLALWVYWGQ